MFAVSLSEYGDLAMNVRQNLLQLRILRQQAERGRSAADTQEGVEAMLDQLYILGTLARQRQEQLRTDRHPRRRAPRARTR